MRTAWPIAVMRLVLQRCFRRRRQSFRVAMACSPRQRILACALCVGAANGLLQDSRRRWLIGVVAVSIAVKDTRSGKPETAA